MQPIKYDLSDCRVAHHNIYDVELHDGDSWVPHGQLAVMRDAVTHDGDHVRTIDYHGANHALLMWGKVGDPTFQARLNMTECGTAFVGTMSTGGGAPQAVRGLVLEQVYHTQRHLKDAPDAPFQPWENFTIKSEWVGEPPGVPELKITYLLGSDDVSNRVRATKVDRHKGETTLEMVAELVAPFRQDAFVIVLQSGIRSFAGTLTDDDSNEYIWRGGTAPVLAEARAAVFRAAHASRPTDLAPVAATMTLQDLDNMSPIQVLIGPDGKPFTVDYAQTTCGGYFNKCLANALDQKWIDGIYGHAYSLPADVQKIFTDSKEFFKGHSVLGTGMMLYDTLKTNPTYKDLMELIDAPAMNIAWDNMGKSDTTSVEYQKASSALYTQGFRDGVTQIQPYLQNNPEKWAEDYFNWLTDSANLLTWQIQVASKQFDNVKTRMYDWYVKLEVLAPNKDYATRFQAIAYAALLGVNYTKAKWSEDLKPFLLALIQNAIAGKVDSSVMDEVQKQAVRANQEILGKLVSTFDHMVLLVDGIAVALTSHGAGKTLQQLAVDPTTQSLIGKQLKGQQLITWNALSEGGKLGSKIGGLLGMLFYGASAGYLLYQISADAKKPQTPKVILQEINMGVLAMALLVKGLEKMMSVGVGRFLDNFSKAGQGGAFRTFAGDIATWFTKGGKIIPQGKVGATFVTIFGKNSTEFMTRRIGPAMALFGLALSAYQLYEAIISGTPKTIIFQTLHTMFALAGVVLIGLQLFSFAWAGPMGIGMAVVGIIVVLVEFIWNLIDPPPPPPDPINEFVHGPMEDAGFVKHPIPA